MVKEGENVAMDEASVLIMTLLAEAIDCQANEEELERSVREVMKFESKNDPVLDMICCVNRMLETTRDVNSKVYKVALRIAKLLIGRLVDKKMLPHVRLSPLASENVIQAVGDFCCTVCIEKLASKECVDEATNHIMDLFHVFMMPKEVWRRNAVYMFPAMVISSLNPIPYIEESFLKMMKDSVYERTFKQMCKNVSIKSKKITYTRVYALAEFAKDCLQVMDDVNKTLRADADRMALALLMEEEKERMKQVMKKKKVKVKKVPCIDEDPVFEEIECIVCMEDDPEVLFDCGHKICCATCAIKIAHKCPYCTK